MNKPEITAECFKNGFNCSQAVFSTYAEEFELDKQVPIGIPAKVLIYR